MKHLSATHTDPSATDSLPACQPAVACQNRQCNGLHILKGVCALAVVIFHCPISYEAPADPICHLAPPLFFMITGYFIADSNGLPSPSRIQKAGKKAFAYLLGCNLIYAAVMILTLLHDRAFGELDFMTTRAFWSDWIKYGARFHPALWYLTALCWSLLLSALLLRLRCFRLAPFIIIAGLAFNLYAGKYWPLFHSLPPYGLLCMSALSIGLPCILSGMLMHRIPSSRRSKRIMLSLLLFSAAALAAEASIIMPALGTAPREGFLLFFSMPLAVAIFYFALHTDIAAGRDLRHLSRRARDIYFLHALVIIMLMNLSWSQSRLWQDLLPFTVCLLCFAISSAAEYFFIGKGGRIMPVSLKKRVIRHVP